MKTVLTLRYSSFLFCNKLTLVKNRPVEVETDVFTDKDVRLLNSYIKSGGITSSAGFVPDREAVESEVEIPATIESVIEIKAPEPEPEPEVKEETKEDEVEVEQPVRSTLDVLDAPVEEVKKAPAKKPATTKKVAK